MLEAITDSKLDEIVSDYEYTWRKAALENRSQFLGSPYSNTMHRRRNDRHGTGLPTCAWLVNPSYGFIATNTHVLPWCCTEEECSDGSEVYPLAGIMMHLNNAHCWTWDMFANKFRDAVQAGREKAQCLRQF